MAKGGKGKQTKADKQGIFWPYLSALGQRWQERIYPAQALRQLKQSFGHTRPATVEWHYTGDASLFASMDGNIAHLHLHTGQELGVVAKNELSFLSLQEEVEIFGLRIGMRICRDHVHRARQWVIIHRNIVLIGAIILRILLLARRNKHHFYIKMVKIGQYGSIVAA